MKLSMDDILLMNAMSKVSGVDAKDCIEQNGMISYLVKGSEVGKAIGKGALNVKKLEQSLKKRVEILGFYEKADKMVTKTFDVEAEEVNKKNGKLIVKLDALNKKKVFSNSGRLRRLKELMKRNCDLDLLIR
ncbi:MAG: KH domain-containing protein [Candidatus Diapherotrites archaeon]|jgi:NusA-like KH domain protein|uniref:KH domain-containing protein n=1 Tax=Candidatus Iainarchaeum sp. TaxID=3101447 RepID=A0A8T5GF15_9ARCH|nr:KH domain-containing protein [Candidatus Diapherotrites archaeon]